MAISAVGGATNNSATNVNTLSVTYAPTNGNWLVLGMATSGTITGLTVTDSNNVALTPGPVLNNARLFYYQVTGGPASFTASWTNNVQVSMAVEEYSLPAGGGVNWKSTFNNSSGGSTTETLTFAILQPNNWIVCLFADTSNTQTGTVGNLRQQTTASSARIALMDNTSASAGNVTCTCTTVSSSGYSAVGLELGGPGQVIANHDLQLTALQRQNQFAHIEQDVLLVITPWANLPLNRVAQEVLLVVTPFTPATQGISQLWVIT
jgi:hypothetical protein